MTIVKAVIEVLKKEKKPMKPSEILENIQRNKLFEFKSNTPLNVIRGQIKRHEINAAIKNVSAEKFFKETSDGKIELL